ncbi:MAG TPA: ROK family protein [Prosthecobacter sp.]|nr:ROK family protein [Prosthecobacter sp.]
MSPAIGIDLGGTNIKAALIDRDSGALIRSLSRPTCDGEFVNGVPRFAVIVAEIISELESGTGQLPVGLSAPGLAHPNGRSITWMPGRMHGIEALDWPNQLDRHVRVLNDAQAALLGEVWLGAAKGCRDAFMITLGTGVGGAVMSGGQLLRGAIGRAGHLGHITVDALGERDVFNTPGSLEAAIGNQTLASRTAGRYATTLDLIDAIRTGDPEAAAVWQKSLHQLAAAIASFINVLDPAVVIVGGGIATGAYDLLFAPLQSLLDQFEWRPGSHQIKLLPAALSDHAGTFGSVHNLLLDPSHDSR